MNVKKRYELITRNLQEVIGEEELMQKLSGKKEISVYWGTMPTGSISIAYFFPMMKIADFLKAGLKVKILLADLHAALDGVSWSIIDKRYAYYKEAIVMILKIIGTDVNKLEFVRGKDFEMDKNYFYDLLKLSTFTNLRAANKAASEVVKLGENPKLSGMIYPLMQALDEEYLKIDIQFGGVDQRKILVFAREYLPKIGYEPRIELMNPMIRGLVGEKMSSSVLGTKIDLMDDEVTVKKAINKAECVSGDSNNGLMALLKYIVFMIKDEFVIERDEKYGGDLKYGCYFDVECDFTAKKLHPMDLKNGVEKEINNLLVEFRRNSKLKKLYNLAYS